MNNEANKIRQMLPDIADRTHAQLCELHVRPSAERADLAAAAAHGLYVHLRQLATALERGGEPE